MSLPDTPRPRRAPVVVLPLVLLLAGVGAGVLTSASVRSTAREHVAARTLDVVNNQVKALEQVTLAHRLSAQALADGFAARHDADDADFRQTAGVLSALPGVATLSAVVPVPAAPGSVDTAQAGLRTALGTQLVLRPASAPDGEHRFVVSAVSFTGAGAGLGSDLATDPALSRAMDVARSSGTVAISRPYVLPGDESLPAAVQQRSVAFVAPVVAPAGQPDVGAFRGWVVTTARAGDLLGSTVDDVTSDVAEVALSDVTDPAAGVPMATVASRGALAPATDARTAALHAGTRQWQVRVRPTSAAVAAEVGSTPLVALLGCSAAGLVAALLLFAVTTGRRRAQRQVAEATATLAAEVADRRRGEQALRTREAELEAYATVVADRLRTPLAQLSRSCLDSRRAGADDPERFERLDRVERRLEDAAHLVDDLLLYARVREVGLSERVVDLAALATAVCDLRAAQAAHLPEELQPRFEVGALPEVVGEAWLLQEVLVRLVDNAVVHAPPGRAAVVALRADLTGSRYRGEVWRVEVADRGFGVPAERRARIFEPFAGEDSDVDLGSNHLSLAVVRRIVTRLGGEVGLDDDPRGGSVFWFTLPVRVTAGHGSAVTAPVLRPALVGAAAGG